MKLRLILYPLVVLSAALPVAAILALFFTGGQDDLHYATGAVSAKNLSGLEPGAAYAFHLETQKFVPTRLCTIEKDGVTLKKETTSFVISNAAGKAISSVVSFIGSPFEAMGVGTLETGDTSQTISWQKEFISEGRAVFREDCREEIQRHVEDSQYAVIRVDTVFLTAQVANEAPRATMVLFRPEQMTTERCAEPGAENDPICVAAREVIVLAQAGWVTKLRAFLIRIETA